MLFRSQILLLSIAPLACRSLPNSLYRDSYVERTMISFCEDGASAPSESLISPNTLLRKNLEERKLVSEKEKDSQIEDDVPVFIWDQNKRLMYHFPSVKSRSSFGMLRSLLASRLKEDPALYRFIHSGRQLGDARRLRDFPPYFTTYARLCNEVEKTGLLPCCVIRLLRDSRFNGPGTGVVKCTTRVKPWNDWLYPMDEDRDPVK